MNKQDQDPLKKLFQSLPELEPPVSLKYRIMREIRGQRKPYEFWILKPAMVLASLLFLAFLGAKITTQLVVPQKMAYRNSSPVLQWAKQGESTFPKISKDKGGFLS